MATTKQQQQRVCVSDLPLGVAEDDGLCDGQRVVKVTQGVELPLLSLHGDEELLDALQGQLITGGKEVGSVQFQQNQQVLIISGSQFVPEPEELEPVLGQQ